MQELDHIEQNGFYIINPKKKDSLYVTVDFKKFVYFIRDGISFFDENK